MRSAPRIIIGGLSGDCGKTAIALAIARATLAAGTAVRCFKKGPDYIDAAWNTWASGAPVRNLDSWLMGFPGVRLSFFQHAISDGLNLIEGARGLFDGFDPEGTHSTAELARALDAPVILVVNVTKMTRTAAALVLGCQQLARDVRIGGVILNRVNGKRHEHIARTAIEEVCGIPVLGVVPKFETDIMPQRHLGLVTPDDHAEALVLGERLDRVIAGLDVPAILKVAESSPELDCASQFSSPVHVGEGLKIAYLRDAAFCFYYPENLEALESGGAELVPVSSFEARELPPGVHALYIGGGFPEVHAARISANTSLLSSIRSASREGLPVYAECGGLMLLAQSIRWQDQCFPMAGVLPIDIEVGKSPQGHGYVELEVDRENPFYQVGTKLRGHEFHYSGITIGGEPPPTACAVKRGVGALQGRDGLIGSNVWAGYTHLHALATPEWAVGILAASRGFKRRVQETASTRC